LTQVTPIQKATIGFILSLIAGIIDAFVALIIIAAGRWIERFMGSMPMPGLTWWVGEIVAIWGAIGLLMAVAVIIGAVLIYTPKREVIGGIIVIVFSILSLFFTVGGLILGLILGIIGGALGIAKK